MEAKHTLGEILSQRLSNEDTAVRDAAWVETKAFILKDETTYEQLLEVWIGLYFWYWHSDGRPYQQTVRNELTLFMTTVNFKPAHVLDYVKAGMVTLEHYWDTIDYVRIKKYERLLCQLIQKYLLYIANCGWDLDQIQKWNEFLFNEFLPLNQLPQSINISVKIADFYYDYLNDVIYIEEAKQPNEDAKKLLADVMVIYLKEGIVESIHKSFVEVKDRLQTDLYKPIGLAEYAKNAFVKEVVSFSKIGDDKFKRTRKIQQLISKAEKENEEKKPRTDKEKEIAMKRKKKTYVRMKKNGHFRPNY
ncbi:hypothetical protein EIN_370120 [Entamoeba invadens IP1]|uniref:Uncharacterized protein n=1 Tax=Entamoeba invadens IP1 TaxID=370355 RepID=A0A0A1UBU3_ENTIV|nr:hypothetical protein EIN_370120 [Entamoeba invadens IP1]ELP92670.1 hypothetical protein EIN_370120 [Entamoeba invadens IP1]|eukprot:XP_004259441.1 hypothetical protein EIN_370120 [Entamoeba invadens IP1]